MIVRVLLPGDEKEYEYTFRRREALIGSSQRTDLCIPLPDVPPRFARLLRAEGRVRLEPLRPGTTLSVERSGIGRIESTSSIALLPGDRIVIGAEGHVATVELVTSGDDADRGPRPTVLFSVTEEIVESPLFSTSLARFATELCGVGTAMGVCEAVSRLADAVGGGAEAAVVLARTETVLPADLERVHGPDGERMGHSRRREIARKLRDGAIIALRGDASLVLIPIVDGPNAKGFWCVRSSGAPDVESLRALAAPVSHLVMNALSQLDQAWELSSLREENRYFRDRQRRHYLFKDLVTRSSPMAELYQRVHDITDLTDPVLIIGEKGTGKEMIARALHHLSERGDTLMISQNCASRTDAGLDQELFGRGGAGCPGQGLLEFIRGGTLFIEEIEHLPALLQTKLARAILEREVRPEGESVGRPVDVRIIASSEEDLFPLVEAGDFRRDLYLQLSLNTLHVPPLRERLDDIVPLADVFTAQLGPRYGKRARRVSPSVGDELRAYPWPGNVRELQGLVEAAVIRASADAAEITELPWCRVDRPDGVLET